MAETASSRPAADRNLLFGILALQMDLIHKDALIGAMQAWVLDKTKPLGQLLCERGDLNVGDRALLEPLVQRHLEVHGHDPARSLAALSSLGSVCEGLRQITDPDVQASLAQLLAANAPGDDSHPTRYPDADYSPPALEPSVGTPTSSGLRFRILRPHAKGGLGQVSVALDAELNREVALKEIQERYADDPESRARFLLEAEVTGGLEHPGIVPVHGLGSYADGRPFYAMRFIKGDSLKEAIARFHRAEKPGRDPGERTLALRELLGRFVDVCNAVAYAHSRGVLHRDLKPGNVMLGKYGETLVVDWGLAKALDRPEATPAPAEPVLRPRSGSALGATQAGSVIGTPAYMSPEQAAGRLDLLGPAADVYSLGATLYCLLTGRAPFEDKDVGVLLLQVQQGAFPRPREAKPDVPAALEAVCLKALTLRPEDRYAGALELAAEVERWLADEPVTCYREPYRVRAARWVRRHQAVAASALVLLLTATAGLAAGLYFVRAEQARTEVARQDEAAQRQVAEQERTRAQDKAAEAQAVLTFFQEQVLAAARPESQDGGLGVGATVRDAVDKAEPKIAGAFADRPLIEAAIRNALGVTYWYLGEGKATVVQQERALALRREHLGPDHADTLTSMGNLARAYWAVGQLDKALPLFEQTLVTSNAALGPEHPVTLKATSDLANAYQAAGQRDKALPLLDQALAKHRAIFGPGAADTLTCMVNLALAYKDAGQLAKALPLFEEVLAKEQETLGPDHPSTLNTLNGLASVYWEARQLDKIVPLLKQVLAKRREKLGPGHPDTLQSMSNLATVYQALNQPGEALPLYEQALAKARETLGDDHPDTLGYVLNLALAYRSAGQLDQAVPLLEQALAKQEKKLGPDHPDTLRSMLNLAIVYRDVGQFQKALALHEQALARTKAKLGPDHPSTLLALTSLAGAYHDAGQIKKAVPLYEQALAAQQKTLGPDHPNTLATMCSLGVVYQDLGQLDRAVPLLEQALAKRRARLGSDHPDTLTSMNNLAGAYQDAGRLDQVAPLLEEALTKRQEKLGPDHPDTVQSMNNLARVYLMKGQLARAERVLRQGLPACEEKRPDASTTFEAKSLLGSSLANQKRYAEAEPLLLSGYQGLKQREAKTRASSRPHLTEALEQLVQLYDAWGKPAEAARWWQELAARKSAGAKPGP